jgi:hypothetical protein
MEFGERCLDDNLHAGSLLIVFPKGHDGKFTQGQSDFAWKGGKVI